MTHVSPNSVQARDIASIVHSGQQFLDAAARLGCASLGYASERLSRVAYEQARNLGDAHLYRNTTNEPGIDLAKKLLQIGPRANEQGAVPVLGLRGEQQRTLDDTWAEVRAN
jgi:adenosylmethionine-8-amino-7-oxononanoate aminotransferase